MESNEILIGQISEDRRFFRGLMLMQGTSHFWLLSGMTYRFEREFSLEPGSVCGLIVDVRGGSPEPPLRQLVYSGASGQILTENWRLERVERPILFSIRAEN